MGFGPDQLRAKALLALEEIVQECRFGPPRRSMAVRFALAYLWALRPVEREAYEIFWRSLASETMWRLGSSDSALQRIYVLHEVERDHDLSMRLWSKAVAERRGSGEADGEQA